MAEESRVVVWAAFAANVAIAVAKFIAAGITGSSALLAEAIHSTADSGNELLLMVGLRRMKRPAHAAHPFGHGKEAYFWSLVVAVMLFAGGGGMSILDGIGHLQHPHVRDATWGYVVLGLSFLFEAISFVVAARTLWRRRRGRTLFATWRASKDPSIYTVASEDAAALLGLVIAFLGLFLSQRLHLPVLDAIASLAVGLLLVSVSMLLAWENRGLLVGEAAHGPVLDDIRRILGEDRDVSRVGDVLTMHLGPAEVLLDAEIDFERSLDGDGIRAAIVRIEKAIRKARPEVTRIFLEPRALEP